MKVEERHWADGSVEAIVRDDDGRTIARLRITLDTEGDGGARYEVETAVRVRGEPETIETRLTAATVPK